MRTTPLTMPEWLRQVYNLTKIQFLELPISRQEAIRNHWLEYKDAWEEQ
ncbi:hypothetical protein NHG28_06425 [Aerococcaceae bacterium NML201209]|nr:hypothetical protein [Aerococcaceae bacterium NML201209]